MIISSRTPEGEPNCCSLCGSEVRIEPALLTGDAPCPNCGHLLWFPQDSITVASDIAAAGIDTLLDIDSERLPKQLLLNFQGVSFLSSAMVTKLVMLNKSCKDQGVQLKICNVGPNVLELFKITKLNKLFEMEGSEEDAIASFDKHRWFG